MLILIHSIKSKMDKSDTKSELKDEKEDIENTKKYSEHEKDV